MSDDRIRRALRELPGATASGDFTARVLARLDEPRRRPAPPVRRLAWLAAAAALIVGVAGWGAWRWEQEREREAALAELAALRLEQTQLTRSLAELREMTAAAAPVVYLGGDDRVDVVWDIQRTGAESGSRRRSEGRLMTLDALQ